jgi:hypothetical protein
LNPEEELLLRHKPVRQASPAGLIAPASCLSALKMGKQRKYIYTNGKENIITFVALYYRKTKNNY